MIPDLFDGEPREVSLAPGAMLLGAFAQPDDMRLVVAIGEVTARAPFRHMLTPGGAPDVGRDDQLRRRRLGERRRRLSIRSPRSGQRAALAVDAGCVLRSLQARGRTSGVRQLRARCLLINRYEPGTRLSLHQDKDERDYDAPIVSVSLGLPAVFQFGGMRRSDPTRRIRLVHGDVVVWGGPSRLRYHGVLPLEDGSHPLIGRYRINLTFRRAT